MTFGEAIEALKDGKRVTRPGWNGKRMYLVLVANRPPVADAIVGEVYQELPVDPAIWMKTAQDTLQPGWLASQADMLAEDWAILD